MAICIETVQKYSPQDVRTPVFIFERLCSIIYPEENDVGEFFLTLEKDPQQEDFLQVKLQLLFCNNYHFLVYLSDTLSLDPMK
jgi:E3 ubiquitin-protein ligase UBR4